MSEQHDTLVEDAVNAVIDTYGAPASDADTKHLMRTAILKHEALRSPAATSLPDGERFITMWRKTGEQCLDWDFHISDSRDELREVTANIVKQGSKQSSTYLLGPQVHSVADLDTPAPAQPEAAGDVVEAVMSIIREEQQADGDCRGRWMFNSAHRIAADLAHPPQAKLDGMEEAAKVADAYICPVKTEGDIIFAEGAQEAAEQIAKNIRALAQQEQS